MNYIICSFPCQCVEDLASLIIPSKEQRRSSDNPQFDRATHARPVSKSMTRLENIVAVNNNENLLTGLCRIVGNIF